MKAKKIIMLLMIILAIWKNTAYAKYVYNFEETIIELTRDANSPVCNVSYSTEEMTNQNVTITITSNKEVQQASGFQLSEDKKVLRKEVSQNESGLVKVRDFAGNYTEVEYNVNNIDKEAPQIIGCENGQTYQSPLTLEFSDNTEIQEITVDRYANELTASLHEFYYDSYVYHGIDRSDTTLTVSVQNHPQNTKKYKYYINDKLYTTTTDANYTFTGLEKGETYTIKIEALDELGNKLDETEVEGKTSYYQAILSNKTNQEFSATFENIDKSVSKIRYAVWNCYNENEIKWYEATIDDNKAEINCTRSNNGLYPSYLIHAYLYDKDENILDVIGFSIDFETIYQKPNSMLNENEITEPGNYEIKVSDFAGNETIYYIKIE